MPQLGDPNFHRAVILMLEHDDKGSMGLVINKPGPLTLKELGREKGMSMSLHPERREVPMFVGGPVQPQRGFVLHDAEMIEEKIEVMPGLYLSLTLDSLRPLLREPEPRLRFCLGYAGWASKQLEQEITTGCWLFSEATLEQVLSSEPEALWERTLRGMGVDPAMLQPGKGIH